MRQKRYKLHAILKEHKGITFFCKKKAFHRRYVKLHRRRTYCKKYSYQ